MDKNKVNENTVNLVKMPWYLSTWFIVLVFIVTFMFVLGIPAAVLAIIRFAKYKQNRIGSGILMGVTASIPALFIILVCLMVNQEGKADRLIKEGRYAEAQAYLDDRISNSDDFIYYRQYADLYVAQGMFDEAVQKLAEYSERKDVCDWGNPFIEKLEECSGQASEQYKVLASNILDAYNTYLVEKDTEDKEVEETKTEQAKAEPGETEEESEEKVVHEEKNTKKQTENAKQEYVFPDSAVRYLLEEEVKKLDADKLKIARNEIFARHGYIFQDKELQQYFDEMTWYSGTVLSEQFDIEAALNEYEKKNIELISKVEEGSGREESKQDVKEELSADAKDAPYLSYEYLQYYIEKNNIKVNTFPEFGVVEKFINNYKEDAVSVDKESGFFKEPYYAMTRKVTGLLYVGQMKDNKPDGIGALLKPVSLSIGENDSGELLATISEYSGRSEDEDIYLARIYMGNFKEGRPEGYGIEFSSPGDDDYFIRTIELNDYKNGEFQAAIFEMANPRKYEGGFQEGKYSGKGNKYMYMETYSYESDNGEEDEEEFDLEEYSDILSEEGTHIMQELLSGKNRDIGIASGSYEKGELNGDAKIYELGYLKYEGEMKKGEQHGKGIEYFSCSEQIQYEGEWAHGEYHGTGTLYNEDGSVNYSGKWEYNEYAH